MNGREFFLTRQTKNILKTIYICSVMKMKKKNTKFYQI